MNLKVALVHDWLIHMRGGEKVLESLAEVFPQATIYTLFSNQARLSSSLQGMRIENSFLHYFPGIRAYYRWLLPFLPFFIWTLRIEGVDLVVSSSHCVAKGVRIPKGAKHICYCHTPMRYLWGFESEYFGKFPKWLLATFESIFSQLRKWDVATSQNVDFFLCNSEGVRTRIKKIYGREATVIYPPVDARRFNPDSHVQKRDYYLIVSALTPYKRTDLAIEAFNGWERPLWIVGDGPERKEYEKKVKTGNIRFLGRVSDETLISLYTEAKAVLFPQEEDFGIVPLEAQACGTPVIAYARGGALESIKEGIFFYEQSPQALRDAVLRFESGHFSAENLRRHALPFDKPRFQDKIKAIVQSAFNEKTHISNGIGLRR